MKIQKLILTLHDNKNLAPSFRFKVLGICTYAYTMGKYKFLLGIASNSNKEIVICVNEDLTWHIEDSLMTPKGKVGPAFRNRLLINQPPSNAEKGDTFEYKNTWYKTIPQEECPFSPGMELWTEVPSNPEERLGLEKTLIHAPLYRGLPGEGETHTIKIMGAATADWTNPKLEIEKTRVFQTLGVPEGDEPLLIFLAEDVTLRENIAVRILALYQDAVTQLPVSMLVGLETLWETVSKGQVGVTITCGVSRSAFTESILWPITIQPKSFVMDRISADTLFSGVTARIWKIRKEIPDLTQTPFPETCNVSQIPFSEIYNVSRMQGNKAVCYGEILRIEQMLKASLDQVKGAKKVIQKFVTASTRDRIETPVSEVYFTPYHNGDSVHPWSFHVKCVFIDGVIVEGYATGKTRKKGISEQNLLSILREQFGYHLKDDAHIQVLNPEEESA